MMILAVVLPFSCTKRRHLPHLPSNIGIEKQFHPIGLKHFNYNCCYNQPCMQNIDKDRKHSPLRDSNIWWYLAYVLPLFLHQREKHLLHLTNNIDIQKTDPSHRSWAFKFIIVASNQPNMHNIDKGRKHYLVAILMHVKGDKIQSVK